MPIIKKLWDLHKQATTENSHYYTASLIIEAIKEITDLREEIKVTDKLWQEAMRVVKAIPPCPVHGDNCIPNALKWVENAKESIARLEGLED